MDLSKIIKNIEAKEVLNFKDIDIKGISYNSNTINSHEIFVCLKGEHVDGHDFAQSAFEKGAVALMCERPLNIEIPQIIVNSTQESIADLAAVFYHNPTASLNLMGVTGTNGKTTVAHLVQKIFEENNKKCALIGTLGYKFSSKDDLSADNYVSGRKYIPDEVAETALFLASDFSKCISGEIIHCNLGNHLNPWFKDRIK